MSPLSCSPKALIMAPLLAPFLANALQQSQTHSAAMATDESTPETPLAVIKLDAKEAAERGSYCMDGGPGSYYYRQGTVKNKWVLAFQGGTAWCKDPDMCAWEASHGSEAPAKVVGNDLSIFKKSPFRNYSHIIFHHCDGGLGLGNRADPLEVQGKKVYLRGKLIVDHTVDDLLRRFDFGSAEEVLLTGGSGGGQATYILADYLASRMPKSVRKFGAIPMNGWWSMNDRPQRDGYKLHNMSGAIPPSCRDALSVEDQWTCIHTDVSYKFTRTPMFIVQLLDYRSASKSGPGRTLEAWHACMFNDKQECPGKHVDALEGLMDEVVHGLQGSAKFHDKGEGGFVSTCTKHTFYRLPEFFHYANNGVTVATAINAWWKNLDTAQHSKWYLPCVLNQEFPHQCEQSCDYGTNGEDQHVKDHFIALQQ